LNHKEYDLLKRIFGLFSFFALVYMLWSFIGYIAIAIAIAYMAKPLYDILKPKLGQTYGAVACLLGIVIPTMLLVLLVVKDVISFLSTLDITAVVQTVVTVANNFGFLRLDGPDVSKPLSEVWNLSKPLIDSFASQISAIPNLIMKLMFLSFMTFYFLKDGNKLKESFLLYVPEEKKENAELLIKEIHESFKTLFIGNAETSLAVGFIAIIGYWIIGIPNPITLGALSGILNILPIVGGWTIYVPLTIYYLLIGEITKGILLGIFGILFLSIAPDFAIRPKIVNQASDLHPALVLVAFLVGPLVFGIAGLAIGPIIVGTIYALHKVRENERKQLLE